MKNAVHKALETHRLIAVIKSSSSEDARAMIKAAMDGGFRIFTISVQTPKMMKLFDTFSRKSGYLFGAGAVTDGEMAQRVISAGAKFISTPYTESEVISVAKHNEVFVIQGALTPTEVVTAHELGADLVSVHPVSLAGGPRYIRSIKHIVPSNIKLMASGGVDVDHVFEYLKDCVAVSVRQYLFERPLIRADDWMQVTERAREFSQKLPALKNVQ